MRENKQNFEVNPLGGETKTTNIKEGPTPENKTLLKNQQEQKEIGLEFVKEIENSAFSVDDKINILLVKAGLKPAATISLDIRIWNEEKEECLVSKDIAEKSAQIIENSGLAFAHQDKSERMYSYKKPDGTLVPYNQEHISFGIGKSKKDLDFLLNALKSKDDELMGKAYGFSSTAIEAWVGKKSKLKHGEMPREIAKSDASRFTPGKLSKDSWREEIKQGQDWADFIKKTSPKLYKEFIKMAEELENDYKKNKK